MLFVVLVTTRVSREDGVDAGGDMPLRKVDTAASRALMLELK